MALRKIAEKLTPKVQIRLDGKDWPIVVTHNILIECEELTGLNVLRGDVNLTCPSAKLVRALLYLCLRRAGADYTLAEVGDLLTPQNLGTVYDGLATAYVGSMPVPEVVDRPMEAVE